MIARRGMTLLEVVGALVLLAALSLAMAELFASLLKVTHDSTRTARPDRRRAQIVQQLREDVWSAIDIRTVGEREIIVRLTGERSVFWRLAPEGPTLRRIELISTRRHSQEQWDTADGSLPQKFQTFGPGVRITWPTGAGADGGVVDLYSQLMSLSGGVP